MRQDSEGEVSSFLVFVCFFLNLNATGICEKNKVNSYNISSGHMPSVETSAVFWISWYTQNKYYNLSTVLINEDTFAKSLVLCFLNDLILNQTKVKGHSLYTLEESQHALSMHACMHASGQNSDLQIAIQTWWEDWNTKLHNLHGMNLNEICPFMIVLEPFDWTLYVLKMSFKKETRTMAPLPSPKTLTSA